ncbi:MAG TPA: PIN domain-containing protein [Candidatus Thermoplasmatota archaeon]|nr:PIN domain-containing protein [Candidatus Thermoplasmatota archaeon]
MTLLSTTFLVDLLRRDAPALDLLRRLERGSSALRVPVVAFADLWEAAGRSRNPPRDMDRVEALLRGYAPAAIEARHAVRAGRLAAQHGLPLRDALLVALAVEEREELVTRDARRYVGVEGLRVLTY